MQQEAERDRMSELPDGILYMILSKLRLKDMMKTCLVSRRWFKFWALRRNLDFELVTMFNEFNVLGDVVRIHYRRNSDFWECLVDLFVKRVDQFMQTFHGEKIESLRLTQFANISDHSSTIDKWVADAIAKGVEQIDFYTSIPDLPRPYWRYYFPHHLFLDKKQVSNLKHLHLQFCRLLNLPLHSYGLMFHKLETLKLDTTAVDAHLMGSLLSNSSIPLKAVCLTKCALPSDLEIASHSLRLLELIECDLHTGSLKISAMQLDVFEYRSSSGFKSLVLSLDTPQLTKVFFHVGREHVLTHAISQFSCLPQLENLVLHVNSDKMQTAPRSGITRPLANLKQLELVFFGVEIQQCTDLLWVYNLIKACPLLQKLKFKRATIDIGNPETERREQPHVEELRHDQLKQVEIAGCIGNWYEIEFAILILQSATSLERLVFEPTRRYYNGGGRWFRREHGSIRALVHWKESGEETVRKNLRGKIPSSVQLVFGSAHHDY